MKIFNNLDEALLDINNNEEHLLDDIGL